jgi:hypothetical protein
MKRLTHLVLLSLVLQFTGMAGICAPTQTPAAHDCCTPSESKAPVRPQTTVPECCFVTAFHEQGTMGQTASNSQDATPDLQLAQRGSAEPALAQTFRFDREVITHPVSPPLSPLKQSCLLLI